MKAPTAARMLAFAVVALFVVSALSVAGTAAAPSALTHNSVASPAVVSSTPVTATAPATSTVTGHNIAAQMAASAMAATKAAGISTHYVFPPRPSATPSQLAQSAAAGYVVPLYTGQPAPMGLGYYGLSAATNGSVVPSILNTTSVQAYVDTNPGGIVANDLFQSSPDSYGIQLNAVTTNVTLFGTGGYSFWTQNVVEFYPDSGFLVLVTNVWNFSGGPLSANVFYTHGPYGTQVGTEYYYAEVAFSGVSYPFNLSLTMTSGITDNRNSVNFTVGIYGISIPYDYVVFNSVPASNPSFVPAVSNYTANGFSYNPIGLTDDFELIFGGPGGGSQADLASANAALGLAYWDATSSTYVSVPSAFSYGGETGETVTGANVAWSNAPGVGPINMTTYGTMTTGPSILEGLWNASGAEGSYPVTIAANPSNAFNVVTPLGGNPNFQVDEAAVAPGVLGDTLYLMPGNYSISTQLSDYAPVTHTIDVTGPTTVPATLSYAPSEGIYTPLWATSNAQLATISSSGAGTPSDPYVLFGGSSGSLANVYGLYNDYTFPVFAGIFLVNTSASVNINNEPSFTAATNTFQFPGQFLPSTNSLQVWFWNVSNVSITNTTFTGGWFGQNAWYPLVFDTFNVVFYASSNNLIYKDTFATPSQGLLLFNGTNAFGPSTGGGGNNTVFGSIFTETLAPTICPAFPVCETLLAYGLGLGLEIAESGDTIVNNAFATPTTAWELPLNLYSGSPWFYYGNNWNLTASETVLPTLANFPNLPFTGNNILGGATQSGNYWWDYGSMQNPYNGANNPVGILPYDENAQTLMLDVYGPSYYYSSYIYPGGDYEPLTTGATTFYVVSFAEYGLPNSAPWGISVSGPSVPYFPGALLQTSSIAGTIAASLMLPNGTYTVTSLYPGEVVHQIGTGKGTPVQTTFTVAGSPKSNTVVFQTLSTYGYLNLRESGLPGGTTWSVIVQGTGYLGLESSSTNLMVFSLPRGTYQFFVLDTSNGYEPKLISGTVRLGASTSVPIRFMPYSYDVAFAESGLASGTAWSVQVAGTVNGHAKLYTGHSKTSTIPFMLSNGTWSFTVKPVKGYLLGGGTGTIVVSGGNVIVNVTFTPVEYAVTFTESGLPASTLWSVTIGSTTLTSTGTTIVFDLTNGTYHYTIGAVSGYTSSATPHTAHVHGSAIGISVVFRPKA